MSDTLQILTQDLLGIYAATGRDVTYVTDSGQTRKYWPSRYLQAVKRAIERDEVVEFVERLVTRDDATRGFGYLQDAGRLDLTVEALVVDEDKAYHHLFSRKAVEMSQARLAHAEAEMARGTDGDSGAAVDGDAKSVELGRVVARAQHELGISDAELAKRAQIDVAWLNEFKIGYASGKSASVAVTERVLAGVGLTLVAAKPAQ